MSTHFIYSCLVVPRGGGQWDSCNTLPHCRGSGSATPAMHCHTALGQWAVGLLQYTASLPGQWAVQLLQCTATPLWGSGQWNSCNTLPRCLGAAGSATSAVHCHTALGQWAVALLQRTASLPGGSGQWHSCNTLPHCLGAVGSATPAIHCLTVWEQWAVVKFDIFLQCPEAWSKCGSNCTTLLPNAPPQQTEPL